jgi:hypothetical protein
MVSAERSVALHSRHHLPIKKNNVKAPTTLPYASGGLAAPTPKAVAQGRDRGAIAPATGVARLAQPVRRSGLRIPGPPALVGPHGSL